MTMHHPEDPMEARDWQMEQAADYADEGRVPDSTAPRDIACKCEGKYTVRLVLAEDLPTWMVFRGTCVCGLEHAHHIPKLSRVQPIGTTQPDSA
jgi:hypothetical protein